MDLGHDYQETMAVATPSGSAVGRPVILNGSGRDARGRDDKLDHTLLEVPHIVWTRTVSTDVIAASQQTSQFLISINICSSRRPPSNVKTTTPLYSNYPHHDKTNSQPSTSSDGCSDTSAPSVCLQFCRRRPSESITPSYLSIASISYVNICWWIWRWWRR